MLDEKKISLMTKISMYEEKEENRELVISKYYKADYVRYNTLKQLVAATVVYWGVVAFYIFMQFEDMLIKINQIDYFSVMYKLLGGYVLFCFAYFVFAYFVYNYRYSMAKKGLTRYNGNLRQLIELEGGFKKKYRIIKDSDIDAFSGNMFGIDDEIDDYNEQNTSDEAMNNENSATKKELKLGNKNSSRGNVSRMDMFNQRVKESEEEKKQQIIANAARLREREKEEQERKLQKQKAIEEERQRIKERRMQLEREQMEKLRMEREQRMAQNRENYTYQGGTEMNNYNDLYENNNEGGEI